MDFCIAHANKLGAYISRRFKGSGSYGGLKRFARGAYRAAKRYVPKGTGRAAGAAIASAMGVSPSVGAKVGSAVSRMTGVGDYTMGSPGHQASWGNDVPSLSSDGRLLRVRMQNKEYLGNVFSSGTPGNFSLSAYDINPGLSSVFPWLSQIAVGFEEYQFNSLIFYYKSTSGDALDSTNTALGSVIMATQYDSSKPEFQNQQQMANHQFAVTTAPSCSMAHAVECKKSETVLRGHRYVRTGAIPSGDDERFYDHGSFQIASVGIQGAAVNIGELWVSYDITFFKTQLITGLGYQLLTDHYFSNGETDAVTTTDVFGTTATVNGLNEGSNIGCTISLNKITFPSWISEGYFKIDIIWNGSSGGGARAAPVPSVVNCTGVSQAFFNGTGSQIVVAEGTDDNNLYQSLMIKINASGAAVNFDGSFFDPPPGASVDIYIQQMNIGAVTNLTWENE